MSGLGHMWIRASSMNRPATCEIVAHQHVRRCVGPLLPTLPLERLRYLLRNENFPRGPARGPRAPTPHLRAPSAHHRAHVRARAPARWRCACGGRPARRSSRRRHRGGAKRRAVYTQGLLFTPHRARSCSYAWRQPRIARSTRSLRLYFSRVAPSTPGTHSRIVAYRNSLRHDPNACYTHI